MNHKQFIQTKEWQEQTFGSATPLSKLVHLKQEIEELENDLKTNNPAKKLEFADCFLLLFGAAASVGMTYQDICDAIQEKHEINLKRKWGKPDINGVVNHIK